MSKPFSTFTDAVETIEERIQVTRTFTATNGCGESATTIQLIDIEDREAPELQVPPDTFIACGADTSTNVHGIATASDNCSGAVTIDFHDVVTGGDCPQRILRVWTARDPAGNTSQGLQVLHVGGNPSHVCPPDAVHDHFPEDVNREKELLIRHLSVVNAPEAKGKGPWSFYGLMESLADGGDTKTFILDWMETWEEPQVINDIPLPPRPLMRDLVVQYWKFLDHPDVFGDVSDEAWVMNPANAPFDLLAIMNRIDLSCEDENGVPLDAGEGRFVFGVRTFFDEQLPFTVIFEYIQPATDIPTRSRWAHNWRSQGQLDFGEAFNLSLQVITRCFAQPQNLRTIRTNENAFDPDWEMREFHLSADRKLVPAPVERTIDLARYNAGGPLNHLLVKYLKENKDAIAVGRHIVPETFGENNEPFVAAHAPVTGIWQAPGIDPKTRHAFALNTCMGCHLNETGTDFRHIFPRKGQSAGLSPFLRNDRITRLDPVTPGQINQMNEMQRRKKVLWAFGDQAISGLVVEEVNNLIGQNPFRSH